MSFRKILVASFVVLALLALGSFLAGEQVEVVCLHTRDATGKEFTTRLWVIDLGDVAWVRVANPQRAWYQRLLANPRVEIERGGHRTAVLAIPDPSPETARTIDEAFAEKYDWVDRWYGLLTRKNPVPVRLVPVESER